MKRFYRISKKAYMVIPKNIDEIIIGSMLGDLTIERKVKIINNKSKFNTINSRLQFKQSIINKEYIDHLYEIFKDYCNSRPIILSYFDRRPKSINQLNLKL